MTEDQLEQEALGWLADVGYSSSTAQATLRDPLLPRLISSQLRLPEADAILEEVA